MNHNSHRASYQHELLHCGNIELPYLKDCQRFIDQVTLFAARQNKKVSIGFTGGEVTEWSDFDALLSYARNQHCMIRFTTNATAESSRLEHMLSLTDSVIIEVHPEFTSIGKILLLLAKINQWPIHVSVNINMMREHWDSMVELHDKILSRNPNVTVIKKMLFDDPIFNTTPQDYDQEQITMLKAQWGDIKIENQGLVEYTDFQTMILENKNKFQGFQCNAGIEQIVVDAWGAVHRGHCRKNGFMGYLKDPELYWYDQPMTCKLPACVNHFDLQATKSFE